MGLAGIASLVVACADEEAIRVSIPAGSELTVALASPLSTDATRAGDTFEARLAEPLVCEGGTVLAKGTPVHGRIVEALPANAVEADGARLTLVIEAVEPMEGLVQPLQTEPIRLVAATPREETSSVAAGQAASTLGALTTTDGGVAIGAATGAGGGLVLSLTPTDGEVLLRTGQRIRFRTREAASIRSPEATGS